MNTQKNYLLLFFLIISILELASQLFDWQTGHFIFKPLVIPALALYFLYQMSDKNKTILQLGLGALLFSWLGDVFLLIPAQQETFFILGLGSFLTAHLIYIILYNKATDKVHGRSFLRKRPGFALPFLFIGAFLFYKLWPSLGSMAVPVGVYTIIIVLMSLSALYRFYKTTNESFVYVMGGAIMFMVSDSILAVNKFLMEVPLGGFLIMATYITAQYLIIEGLIRHKNLVDNANENPDHHVFKTSVNA
jgi:uncharacterized membrane protein YhhN